MSEFWHQLTFFPLKWIWFGGLHPSYNSKFATIHFCFNFVYYSLILVLAVLEIWISLEDNVYDAIESVLTIFLYLHILGKYTILHLHKSTLSRLLEERSKFWKIEDVDDETTRKECLGIVKSSLLVIKGYLTYSCLVALSFLVQPFITGQLPVLLYVPKGWYYFLEASFWYLTPSIVASIWGVDTTFYSVSKPVIVQFKLLAYKFERLYMEIDGTDKTLDKIKEEMKELVNYHNFLIWYSKEINRMFSGIFLIQFLVAIATSCMQLFIATEGRFDLSNKFKCLSYFIMQIIETGIYCFTTESITANCENIGNAIYQSKWYNLPLNSVKKDVSTIIKRAQKPVVFSGFELVFINKETFTRIFKTALSFYTYLNTMVYND